MHRSQLAHAHAHAHAPAGAVLPWIDTSPRQSLPALPSRAQLSRRFRLLVIDSALWTATTLAALPIFAAHVMHLPFDLRPSAVIFFSGLLIYNLDHFADSHGEAGSAEMWVGGIGRSRLAQLIVGSALAITALLLWAPPAVGQVFALYGLVGVLYGLPVLPRRGPQGLHWLRLKDIPGLKAAIVASSICVAAIGLPLAYAPGLPHSSLLLPVAFTWVLVVSNAVMCDVGDLEADRASGVPTLPVLLGVRRTRWLLAVLNLAVVVIFMGAWAGAMVGAHPEVALSELLVVLYVTLVPARTAKQTMSLALDGCSFAPIFLALILHGTIG